MRFVVALLTVASPLLAPLAIGAQDRPLPPEQAATTMQVPPGFKVTLFAAEPAIVQPMSFTFDDRGRVWVVECLSYPTWNAEGKGHDRVTILEDTDGDGRHDKRTVFYDQGVNLSSIEVGFGGVWLTAVPNLIFIPDANGDDKPDGPPRVLLDGWDLKAKHNVVGNLAWGPDGWLYGCNGISSPSLVGKPGTPEERRVALNCSVWRYHPVRQKFEVYANGTTNPWGIDWDERGELFITNCVIKHIFHVVPGAHFVRMFGQDLNPHVYGLMESCADHQHWAGAHWTSSRSGPGLHNDAGGGHAHSGCMIYLGDNWPAEYRGNAFMCNIHGQRLNRDVLERQGSGYVAKHAADFAFSKDPWFRGLHVKYGPDGGVYVSDWSDTGECHDNKEEQCDKTGGRIFKIVYEKPQAASTVGNALRGVPSGTDLAMLSDAELAALQAHANEWQVRHSRRILQERAASGKLNADSIRAIKDLVIEPFEIRGRPKERAAYRVRSLFTWHVTGQLDATTLAVLMEEAPDEEVRAWSALLAVESHAPSPAVLEALVKGAVNEKSPFVRLHLAAALQRVPLDQRWRIAEGLLSHAADDADPYLPLMDWYAVEPLVPHDVRKAIELLPQVKIPLVRQYLVRRIISVHEENSAAKSSSNWVVDELLRTLAKTQDTDVQADILRGLDEAYRGRRNLKAPAAWNEAYAVVKESADRRVREGAEAMAVLFGDQLVISRLHNDLAERPGNFERQKRALPLLHARRDPEFARLLQALVLTRIADEICVEAIRDLADYDNADTPEKLMRLYSIMPPSAKQDVIQTLTARPAFALALLDAIAQGKIPRQDVSALVIRELQALDDKAVNERLKQVWGEIRPPSAQKKERIAQLKSQLTEPVLKSADLSHGRALFAKACAACHKLFDDGGRLGPELTGSQRANLDYVLDNVLDPSAIVPGEFKVNVLRLADGRVVQGVIVEETRQAVAVQTPSELVRVPTEEIEARKESSLSMMPEGLFDRLSAEEIRDLVAYLASPQQVPPPAGGSQ